MLPDSSSRLRAFAPPREKIAAQVFETALSSFKAAHGHGFHFAPFCG
jgi:hypothetical protein